MKSLSALMLAWSQEYSSSASCTDYGSATPQGRQCRTWKEQESSQDHQGATLIKEDSHHLLQVQERRSPCQRLPLEERREGREQDPREEEDGSCQVLQHGTQCFYVFQQGR